MPWATAGMVRSDDGKLVPAADDERPPGEHHCDMHAIEETTVTRDGELLQVRRLGACDRDAIAEVFERMSPQSRQMRFLSPKPMLTEGELRYLTDLDHTSHDALAALAPDGRIVAVARYAAWRPGLAELAV